MKNEIGNKYGRLTVIGISNKRGKCRNFFWLCKCECGIEKEISGVSLRRGATLSCGCLQREKASLSIRMANKMPHLWSLIHGDARRNSRTVEYDTWLNMKNRTMNQKHKSYSDYGGRGISICERWLGREGFANFLFDMERKPSPRHSIDRIDNEKGYSPDNCRWSTRSQQNANRRKIMFCKRGHIRLDPNLSPDGHCRECELERSKSRAVLHAMGKVRGAV